MTFTDSPEGYEGQSGRFLVHIAPNLLSGTCNPSGSPPLPCDVTVNGPNAAMHGKMKMGNGDIMHLTAYLQKKSANEASIIVETRLTRAGITSAVTGIVRRQ